MSNYSYFDDPDFIKKQNNLLDLKKKFNNISDSFGDDNSISLSKEDLDDDSAITEETFSDLPGEEKDTKSYQKTGDIINSSLNLGTAVYKNASSVAQNDGEAIMNSFDMAGKGALTGMMVGGPVGAVIGGGAGLIYGIADGISDIGKRGKIKKENYLDSMKQDKVKREQEQRMKDGEDSLEKLTAIRKAQLGYMI